MKLLSCFLLLFGSLHAFAETAPPKRPNFVFVYTDDQRWDAIGFIQKAQGDKARFPWLKTPNMDRLRSQGVWFSNAFCTTSLCSPSRASFLTGQYAHTHGVTNNHTPLATGSVTYATALRDAGYATGFYGKWHMGDQPERPGFESYATFRGQGKFFNCPLLVRKNGVSSQTIATAWVDDASADFAIEFLKENKDRPFVLSVGFKSVHGPRTPHPDFKDDYADDRPAAVPNLTAKAPFRDEPAKAKGGNFAGGNVLDYFRTLTSVDRSLGKLLDALDELQLDKNTIVVFTSDNGYYLGEHGLGDKRSAYEESLRLPFIVRSPFLKSAGGTITSMALNIDIAPTFLDFAGIPIPAAMQGRSLRPLLEDRTPADWRQSFLYEYFYERNFRNPTILGLRTTDDKIITYPGREQWNEVYELKDDPYELTNQYGNPEKAETRKRLEAELERLKKETNYVVPSNADPDRFGQDKPKKGEAKDSES